MRTRTQDATTRIMSSIRGKDTVAELAIRRRLWVNGFRYRVHPKMVGRPDIVFLSHKIAIFIDGDLWHGNSWRVRGLPSLEAQFPTRTEWWVSKIQRNMERDRLVTEQLIKAGWTVLRYWESTVLSNPNVVAKEIAERVRGAYLPNFICLDQTCIERKRLTSAAVKSRE